MCVSLNNNHQQANISIAETNMD